MDVIPELEAEFQASKRIEEVQVFRGKGGLKTVVEDVLRVNKTWYVLGGARNLSKALEYYFPHWSKRREEQGLKIKIIRDSSMRKSGEQAKNIEVRYLKSEFKFPANVGIYGDNVVEFLFGEEPLIIIIRSEMAAKGFMEYFNLLWKMSKE